jgi:hypothetical protein
MRVEMLFIWNVSSNVCLPTMNLFCKLTDPVLGARAAATLTCVWCRAKWVDVGSSTGANAKTRSTSEGYLNLGAVAGVSPVRDTSSCTDMSPFFEDAVTYSYSKQIIMGRGVDTRIGAVASTNTSIVSGSMLPTVVVTGNQLFIISNA